ncbi:hypothetical protein, partial [Fibrobacter sp. UWS1]|uniref:hypothetical protein n=1 Tax=Fibrobacter sp. UWS1 TaxID=1896220 RepID=UPI001E53907E
DFRGRCRLGFEIAGGFRRAGSKKDDFDSENPWKESLSEEKTTRPLDAGENCSPLLFEKKSDSAAEKNTSATKKR